MIDRDHALPLARQAQHLDISRGSIALPSGPGLGITLDEEKLARYSLTAA